MSAGQRPALGLLVAGALALLVTGLALGAAPRSRFAQAVALFAAATAGGFLLVWAFSGSTSC